MRRKRLLKGTSWKYKAMILFVYMLLLIPSSAFGWGAGMHATMTSHAHERMTSRWASALDHGLMLHGSYGPDVWYILSDDFMSMLCPIACGGDDGRISNECWGRYTDPDRSFAYSRHLLVNCETIQELSWSFGYAAHTVEDWRGHLEYIIPDWRSPEGDLYSRHTMIDSTGAALAFNVWGFHGYPTRFPVDREIFGYKDGGFLSTENFEQTGGRDPEAGLIVGVRELSNGDRIAQWNGGLNPEIRGVGGEDICRVSNAASLGSASEGILAAQYGMTDYDAYGNDFPIVVEDGAVAIDCGTNYCQRFDSELGGGGGMACQVNMGAISGLAQWDSYLKPADESSEEIVVNREEVEEWMDKIAGEFSHGGVRMDDNALFGIDPDTGKSTLHLEGVDGRDYTYGRTMPEIVDEVLDLNIQDVTDQLFENGHVIGTVLQSRLSPLEKARFVAFGFHYRPRMSAWPDSLPYEDASVQLSPLAPGPFASVQLPVDLRPEETNAAPEMVFPYYLATLRFDPESLYGQGRIEGGVSYRDAEGNIDGEETGFTLDWPAATLTQPGEMASLKEEEGEQVLRIVLDNREGGWFYYPEGEKDRALMLQLNLVVTDETQPPFDWLWDIELAGYCDAPDLTAPAAPPSDNKACPLAKPDFPEPESDGDMETDANLSDGDLDNTGNDGSDDGCRSASEAPSVWLLLLIGLALYRRKRWVYRK